MCDQSHFFDSQSSGQEREPLSDDEFVKDCLAMFAAVACPDKKSFVEKISPSHQTIAKSMDDLAINIQDKLSQRLAECELFSCVLMRVLTSEIQHSLLYL